MKPESSISIDLIDQMSLMGCQTNFQVLNSERERMVGMFLRKRSGECHIVLLAQRQHIHVFRTINIPILEDSSPKSAKSCCGRTLGRKHKLFRFQFSAEFQIEATQIFV